MVNKLPPKIVDIIYVDFSPAEREVSSNLTLNRCESESSFHADIRHHREKSQAKSQQVLEGWDSHEKLRCCFGEQAFGPSSVDPCPKISTGYDAPPTPDL